MNREPSGLSEVTWNIRTSAARVLTVPDQASHKGGSGQKLGYLGTLSSEKQVVARKGKSLGVGQTPEAGLSLSFMLEMILWDSLAKDIKGIV